jgi:hypothetical protein
LATRLRAWSWAPMRTPACWSQTWLGEQEDALTARVRATPASSASGSAGQVRPGEFDARTEPVVAGPGVSSGTNADHNARWCRLRMRPCHRESGRGARRPAGLGRRVAGQTWSRTARFEPALDTRCLCTVPAAADCRVDATNCSDLSLRNRTLSSVVWRRTSLHS